MKPIIKLSSFLFLFLSSSLGICQDLRKDKNNIYLDYTFLRGEKWDGGDIFAQGVVIGYSRYVADKLYGDISYGAMNFEGKNSKWFLSPEEMSFINMRTFTLGLGYDFFQRDRVTLSGEVAYLYQSNEQLIMLMESGNIRIRETGVTTDNAIRAKPKATVELVDNLNFIAFYAHGFRFSKYSSNWLSLGIGYSF
jgi:hypothetical protein